MAESALAVTATTPRNPNTELEAVGNENEEQNPGDGSEERHDDPPDWWKWMIVFDNIFVSWFSIGLNYGIWLILPDLRSYYDEYNYGKGGVDIKWMVYINIFMAFFFGLFAAPFANLGRNGPRITAVCGAALSTFGLFVSWFATNVSTLCVTYGFITGVGFGLMLTPSLGMIPRYFNRRGLDMANSLAFLGASVSLFYMPPLLEYAKTSVGRRGLFVILSCMNAQMMGLSLLLRPITQREDKYDSDQEDDYDDEVDGPGAREGKLVRFVALLDLRLFLKPMFLVIVIAEVFVGMGHNILVLHLEQNAVAAGVGESDSQWLPLIYGIAMVAGLLSNGIFSLPSDCCGPSSDNDSRFYTNKIRLLKFGFALGVVGIIGVVSFAATTFAGFIAIAVINGYCCGFYLTLMVTLVKVFVHRGEGRDNHAKSRWRVTAALGFALPAFGIGALIGLPIGDLINESLDNPRSSYFMAGAALLFADVVVLIRGTATMLCVARRRIQGGKGKEGKAYEDGVQMAAVDRTPQNVNIVNYQVHNEINIHNAGGTDNALFPIENEPSRPKFERAQSTPVYL